MKQNRKTALIQILASKNNWCTANSLSKALHVSTRTIRKYVEEINLNEPVIDSSSDGYKLLNGELEYDVQYLSPRNRIHVILKELITHSDGLDKYDLCHDYFVSISTIENDLVQANKLISEYNLAIHRKDDFIFLNGEEKNKRKLMSFIMSQETSKGFLQIHAVQEAYPSFNVISIKENILSILAKYNLYINDYLINNLLLHLVITLDRIKHNKVVNHSVDMSGLKGNIETFAAQEIADYIEKEYEIRFNDSEVYHFALLLSSKTTLLNYKSLTPDMLNHFVDQHCINIAKNLIDQVYKQYYIELDNDEFFIKFTLHIRNLVYRVKNKQMVMNPLTSVIKQSYPLIHEISVYIANQLSSLIHTEIPEDEIAYIAFHIGSCLERKENLKEKILCAVICPNYYDMQLQLTKNIENKFHDEFEVIKVTSEVIEEELRDVDLIISTLPTKQGSIPIVNVHPYLTTQDYDDIKNKVDYLNKIKQGVELKKYFDLYFNRDLFRKNIYLDRVEDYISFMSNLLYEKGYVTENHEKSVLEREKMSSTAFNNNVAVPHSMNMDAIKTGICIVTLEKPIQWGDEQVQVIIMFSINNQQRKLFSEFFEGIINILSEWKNINKITNADSYDEFMETTVSLLLNEE